MKARVGFACFLIALLCPPPSAEAQDGGDIRLGDRISREISTYPRFTIFDDMSASIDQGVVTLTGKVTMPIKRDEIGRIVAGIDGVREVRNQIEVLPASAFDEDLRYRIARAIYGNPAFWNYTASANPPIHIIVDRGRVTLTGVVNSNVERMLARSLATGRGEISVTNELRTDSEMRAQSRR